MATSQSGRRARENTRTRGPHACASRFVIELTVKPLPRRRATNICRVQAESADALDMRRNKSKPTNPHGLGPHVKRLREVRRLTQDELAERSGLAADTIRRLEHEEFAPSLRTLAGIARGLNVTLVALLVSWALDDFEIPRGFAELFATRSRIEQDAFAAFWKTLIPELDGVEAEAEPEPEDEQDAKSLLGRAFGRHVRSLRRGRGMTQEVLAERCGLSADTIRRLERGSFSPSLDTLRKLCKGLDLLLGTLFDSFEVGERDFEREIIDLLRSRPRAQRALGYRMLRAFLQLVDKIDAGNEDGAMVGSGRVVSSR